MTITTNQKMNNFLEGDAYKVEQWLSANEQDYGFMSIFSYPCTVNMNNN